MFKKTALALIILAGLFVPNARAWWGEEPGITMLVVPAEKKAVRIAQDMASLRPVLLVTYQQTGDSLRINAWNGKSWVGVTPEDYVNGAFFATAPEHVILVEKEGVPASDILIPDGSWCAHGNRLTSTEPRVLIHLLGRYFDLSYQTWKDLTWRYQLPLEEINPGLVNIPWWHFRANEIYQARMKRNLAADLEKWLFLDITPPDPVEPADMSGPLGDQPLPEDPEEDDTPTDDQEVPGDEADQPAEADAAPAEQAAAEQQPAAEIPADAADEKRPAPAGLADPSGETAEEPAPANDNPTTADIVADLSQTDLTEAGEPAAAGEEPPAPEPAEPLEADPFSGNDIPPAEVVEPPADQKRPWWKFF